MQHVGVYRRTSTTHESGTKMKRKKKIYQHNDLCEKAKFSCKFSKCMSRMYHIVSVV